MFRVTPERKEELLPGILPNPTLTRRRAIQAGFAVAASALTGSAAIAAQDGTGYTFIVAGLDYREGFDEHNSDVLMIARVNTELGTVNGVSIPRDLYIDIPGYGTNKITKAFDSGYYANGQAWESGAQVLTDTISQSFGLAIDGVATTTFEGFKRIVDAVGGVAVDNPYEVIGFGDYPSFPEGPQTLNGEAALVFVRTRKQDGDGGRNMRQQLVLTSLLDKLQQPGIVAKPPALVDSVRDAVQTNIPANVQATLLAALPSIDPASVTFTTIDDQLVGGTLDNGMWVYQADWATLPGYVQALLDGA